MTMGKENLYLESLDQGGHYKGRNLIKGLQNPKKWEYW